MDDASWAALTLSLTLLGGIWTWFAFRRSFAAGLRGVGLTLLPLAAYLTDTLRMFTRIVDAVGDWATSLVFSPRTWLGLIVLGVAVLAFAAARVLDARRRDRETPQLGRADRVGRGEPAVQDDDMAEIEALLRKRGIS